MDNKKSTFDILAAINVDEWIELKPMGKKIKDKKTGLWVDGFFKYLSWMKSWEIIKSKCPDANYEVKHFDGKPYLYDENLGYLIYTSVTINGECLHCWLPVTDGRNDAMKHIPYEYEQTKIDFKTKEKTTIIVKVSAATMFDINTTTMRCIAKNFAMHGLGSYLYTGEDLPFLGIEEENKKPSNFIISKPLVLKVDDSTQLAIDLINTKARIEEFNDMLEQFKDSNDIIKRHLIAKARIYNFEFDVSTKKFCYRDYNIMELKG